MSEKKVLAKVEDVEITEKDVMQFLNDVGPQVAMQFQSPEGIQKVVDELVNQQLLYLEAKENKLDETEEFKLLEEETKENLLKNYALNKLIANENVTEEEIKKHYDDNKSQYQKEESVKAKHILVDSENEAKEAIKEIEDGSSFEEVAKKYSKCPSKESGGNLGEFTRGKMVPEFEEAAFAMEEGSLSEPVKSEFGYHVIQLDEKVPAGVSSFEEVRNQINEQLLRLKQQEKYLNKIEELKGKYKVEKTN